MSQFGVRELKNQLSRYLKRVQNSEEILVTERGRFVAWVVPAEVSSLKQAMESFLREGLVRWNGGKHRGTSRRPVIRGRTLADMVVEDRR